MLPHVPSACPPRTRAFVRPSESGQVSESGLLTLLIGHRLSRRPRSRVPHGNNAPTPTSLDASNTSHVWMSHLWMMPFEWMKSTPSSICLNSLQHRCSSLQSSPWSIRCRRVFSQYSICQGQHQHNGWGQQESQRYRPRLCSRQRRCTYRSRTAPIPTPAEGPISAERENHWPANEKTTRMAI